MTEFEPSLSYAGTSGNVNVDTSRDATIHADLTGITNKAQRYVLTMAGMMREKGVTVIELRERNGAVHHGRVSAALTNLHMAGRLVRLQDRRLRSHIYVLPEFANGRETLAYKPNRKPIDEEVIVGVLLAHRFDPQPTNPGDCDCGWRASREQYSHVRHVAREITEALS